MYRTTILPLPNGVLVVGSTPMSGATTQTHLMAADSENGLVLGTKD